MSANPYNKIGKPSAGNENKRPYKYSVLHRVHIRFPHIKESHDVKKADRKNHPRYNIDDHVNDDGGTGFSDGF